MSRLPRPTVRLRLTLLFGGLFLMAGALLLGINYALTARLTRPPGDLCVEIAYPIDESGATDPPALDPSELAPQSGADCLESPDPATLDTGGPAVPSADVPVGLAIDGLSPAEFLRDQQRQTLRRLLVQSGAALAVMAVGSVGLGWYLAGRALRPLHDITAAAQRISLDDLNQRIGLDGPADELQELADTFDAMLARLEAALASQQRFVADASHELRTPLAIMRTELEVTLADRHAGVAELRRMGGAVHDALARSERLVESLLVLARSERSIALDEAVDLGEVAAGVAATAGAEADEAHMTLATQLWPATVRGHRQLIERLVANLVENGIHHGRAGGMVQIRTSVVDGRPTVAVVNDGIAVDPADGDRMFEPFVRLGEPRTAKGGGAGLGLAIVRSVTIAHGASIVAAPRLEGGLHVTVSFSPEDEPASGPAPG